MLKFIWLIFRDLLILTTAPEILLRILFCPETLEVETQNISRYIQWVYKVVGEENV